MNTKLVALRNILLAGVSFGLAACGGGGNGPALVSTPPPVAAPAQTPPVTPAPAPGPVVNVTKTLTTGLSVRQPGVDYYQDGDYIVYINSWGAEKLNIPKNEYSQKVEIQTATFPNKTLLTWQYPNKPYGEGNIVYGFPAVAFGKTTLALSGYNTQNAIGKVGDIQEFKTAYDITLTGDMKYINLMHDIWLWDDKTGKIGAEILFSVKPNEHILYWGNPKNYFGQKPGARSVQFTQNGVNYNMLISPSDSTDALVDLIPGAKNIIIIPTDGSQNTSGTIDWMQVLTILLESKDIDPNWLFKGVKTGVEVQAGSGSMLVNSYNVTLKLKNQQVQAIVAVVAQSTASTTAAASQINTDTIRQIINAAATNPKTTTYTFGQNNIGVGTNFSINNKLSIGASNVFRTGSVRGYTMASNLAWRNKNNYAILIAGAGKLHISNTDTSNTFAALEAGSKIPTKFAAFAPYTRLGYTKYYSASIQNANMPTADSIGFNSIKLSGGMNADIPLNKNLLLRVSGEASNEFLGRTQAIARMNYFSTAAQIDISGIEYTGSANLSTNFSSGIYTQMEIGSKKNRDGTTNYANVGMKVLF